MFVFEIMVANPNLCDLKIIFLVLGSSSLLQVDACDNRGNYTVSSQKQRNGAISSNKPCHNFAKLIQFESLYRLNLLL